MGIGWIDNVYNNTSTNWYLSSIDSRHNGELATGSGWSTTKFTLDDGRFKLLKPRTAYRASWCGIPWYYNGRHYKVLSQQQSGGVRFYTSELEGKNWIMYEEVRTGRPVAKQEVPKGSDFHCNLRFETNGPLIEVVNNNAFSGENAFFMIYNESKEWVKVLGPLVAQLIKGAAK